MPEPRPISPVAVPESVVETRHSPMWRVLIHNDDITPMNFVVEVLQSIWKIGFLRAGKIMIEAHFRGVALVAVETKEQAEFHIEQAVSMARPRNYPLCFSMEPA